MKKMKVARGTARAQRRTAGGRTLMKPPSVDAQVAQAADQALANHKLSVKLFHKSGAGIA
jgi:hypothetical protein